MLQSKDIFMQDMTWPELQERLQVTDIAIVPVGQTEQHGRHLPIDVDCRISRGLAQRVAEQTYQTAKAVVAPTIQFGYSDIPYFRSYPGVFSLQPETLVNVYKDVTKSLLRMGFSKIFFINGHAPNPPFVTEAIRQVTKESKAFLVLCDFFAIADKEVKKILKEMDRPSFWGHAGLIETSVSKVFGAQVREAHVSGRIPQGYPEPIAEFASTRPVGFSSPLFEHPATAKAIWGENSPGTIGDPTGYSDEIAERVIQATIDPIVTLVNQSKDLHVDTSEYLSTLEV